MLHTAVSNPAKQVGWSPHLGADAVVTLKKLAGSGLGSARVSV